MYIKKIYTLFSGLLAFGAVAQTTVDNNSFEGWTDEVAVDSIEMWTTSQGEMANLGYETNTWQDGTDPQDGSFSVYMETMIVWNEGSGENDTIFGYCVQADAGDAGFTGFPYSDTVDQMTFWYKCDVMAGDTAYAIIQVFDSGSPATTMALFKMTGTVSTWTEVNLAIPGGSLIKPDSVWIGFASSDPFNAGAPDEGSVLEIDNVTLQFTAGSTVPSAVPNYSFEDLYELTTQMPTDWYTFNIDIVPFGLPEYAVASTDASDGTYSIEITCTPENNFVGIPNIATNGYWDWDVDDFAGGDPFGAQPARMLFDYQYAPSGTDTAYVWAYAWNASMDLVDTFFMATSTVSAWTTDTIPMTWAEAPDSILIVLWAGDQNGTVMKVDNIRFEGGDLGNNTLYLSDKWNLFPNPSNDVATVVFKDADEIDVLNIAGKQVFTAAVTGEHQTKINTADWPEGIYIVRLKNDGIVETKKLVVSH